MTRFMLVVFYRIPAGNVKTAFAFFRNRPAILPAAAVAGNPAPGGKNSLPQKKFHFLRTNIVRYFFDFPGKRRAGGGAKIPKGRNSGAERGTRAGQIRTCRRGRIRGRMRMQRCDMSLKPQELPGRREGSIRMNRKEKRKVELEKARKRTGFRDAFYVGGRGICFRKPELKQCRCGGVPVIERSVFTEIREWVIRCPKCDLRAATTGSYKDVRDDWNEGRYSPDSVLISMPIRHIDMDGAIQLIAAILREEEAEEEEEEESEDKEKEEEEAEEKEEEEPGPDGEEQAEGKKDKKRAEGEGAPKVE